MKHSAKMLTTYLNIAGNLTHHIPSWVMALPDGSGNFPQQASATVTLQEEEKK